MPMIAPFDEFPPQASIQRLRNLVIYSRAKGVGDCLIDLRDVDNVLKCIVALEYIASRGNSGSFAVQLAREALGIGDIS